ncbi:MAG TPA: ABC transporter permease [Ktedonobacteraceae bacterium]|nr:ABC transporter permease [Ktedonobacteraceae bacterium]
MPGDFMRAVWIILKHDLRIWIQQPINMTATLVPALCFLLITAVGSSAVGHSPVALVALDQSPAGQQMQRIFQDNDTFRITNATPEQAQALFKNLQVVAVITIPADFSQRVAAHQTTPIDVTVNNLNTDFTNDIRAAVPDAITQFYGDQGSNSAMKVQMQEHDLRQRDIELFQYTLVPIVILLLTMSGVVNSGLATAREWESLTVKELLFAPIARGAIIIGKALAGFVTTMVLGMVILVVGNLAGWIHLEGIYWLTALLTVGLISLMGAGVGVAMGAILQRLQPVISLGLNIVLYLFFLSGGVGVLAFLADWLQAIGSFVPLTYGRHALEMAVFYNSSELLGRDVAVLGGCALVALALGFLAMRREIFA